MLRGRAAPQAQLMLDKVLGEHLEGEARLTQASKALVAEQREAVGLAMSLVDQMDRLAAPPPPPPRTNWTRRVPHPEGV